MSEKTSYRREPDGMAKCYACDGRGWNVSTGWGVVCEECGGYGKVPIEKIAAAEPHREEA